MMLHSIWFCHCPQFLNQLKEMLRFTTTGFIAETGQSPRHHALRQTRKHLFSVPSKRAAGSDTCNPKTGHAARPAAVKSIQRSLDSSLSVVGCRLIGQ